MSLSDLASLGSLVSGVAVLVSLVYLALQVRQATRSQRSETQGSATQRRLDVLIAQTTADAAAALNMGMRADPNISPEQITQFIALCNLVTANAEDEFFQHRDGLLDERRFVLQRGIVQAMAATPGFRAVWQITRAACHPDFAAFVDEIVQQTHPVDGNRFFETFRALAAQQRAAAMSAS